MTVFCDGDGSEKRQSEFVGTVDDGGFFLWNLFFDETSLQMALLDVGDAVLFAVVLSDEESFQCSLLDKFDESAGETFVLLEEREVLRETCGVDLLFQFLHLRRILGVAAERIAIGEARVSEEVFVVVIVVDACGWNHTRQDGESIDGNRRMRGVQFAQIGDEGLDFVGRFVRLACCEQTAVEKLVDGDDGGVALRQIFTQPLLRLLRLARHRVVVLHLVGQGGNLCSCDIGGVEHELAARRSAVERHEHDASRLFAHGVERCAVVRRAQESVEEREDAEREDGEIQQSLFQGSSS